MWSSPGFHLGVPLINIYKFLLAQVLTSSNKISYNSYADNAQLNLYVAPDDYDQLKHWADL